ncbi:MAG: YsnF/AvaK domain-containing protein [Chloroflexota bacterium]|nr:YsnF/AvaK domain-containing protein [Chloroflexota bacterium]
MAELKRSQAYRVSEPGYGEAPPEPTGLEATNEEAAQTIELREEQLVANKHLQELGEIEVRTEVEEIPGRLEVDAYREEVLVEHEPVGQMVSEREKPWEEDGVLVIPIYEEQLVVTKRLMLKERMRVRRVGTTERQLFEDTLRRERLVVEDPRHTGLVREQYPTDRPEETPRDDRTPPDERSAPEGGFLEHLVRKAFE